MPSQIVTFQPTNVRADKAGQFDFLCQLFGKKEDDGYVCFCRKAEDGNWKQEFYTAKRIKSAAQIAQIYIRGDDAYITPNSFKTSSSRTKANIAHLDCCFIDIDYTKKKQYAEQSPEQMSETVIEHCKKYSIPMPTFIVSSGNGLHIWWIFRQSLDSSYLKVWDAVQNTLCKSFAQFGADPAAKDAARVLRIPNTFNAKNTNNKKCVKVLYSAGKNKRTSFKSLYRFAENYHKTMYYSRIRKADGQFDNSTPLYIVESLVLSHKTKYNPAPEFIPFEPVANKQEPTEPVEPVAKEVKHRQRRNETEEECSARHTSAAISVHVNRVRDLKTLITLRNNNMTGNRENTLFYLNHFLMRCKYSANERSEILNETNTEFTEALPQYEVNNILDHRSMQYDPSNAKIIEVFHITEEEQMMMHTIFGPEERKRREILKNKRKMSNEEWRAYMAENILAYLAEGMKISDIADALHVTSRTIRNYINRFSLSTDGLSHCAHSDNQHDNIERRRAAKKAAAACLENVRSKVSPGKRKKKKKKNSKKFTKKLFDMIMQIAQKQDNFFEQLATATHVFFERTGKLLAIEKDNGKISYTQLGQRLLIMANTTFWMPQYGKNSPYKSSFLSLCPSQAINAQYLT